MAISAKDPVLIFFRHLSDGAMDGVAVNRGVGELFLVGVNFSLEFISVNPRDRLSAGYVSSTRIDVGTR
jgi:hypothetical protein